MADATGAAAAALGGDSANAGAPAPTPTPSGAPAPAPTPSAANDAWYAKLAPEHQGWLEKKGWTKPESLTDVVKGYAELERQYRSGDKLTLPKDDTDADGWNQVFARLGRPDAPEKYVFPQGVDEATVKVLAPELHKLGLTQKQVEGLAKLDLGRASAAIEQQQGAWLQDQSNAMKALESEWGTKMPEEIEHNRRAMRALGISVEQASVFMRAGAEKFLRLLNMAGRTMREDNIGSATDEGALGFGMTPNRAAAEIQEKKNDKAFWARYQKGDKAAQAVMDRLYKIQSGERA